MGGQDWGSYWQGRWERREIGWHQAEVEPHLAREFGSLAPTTVLVPLCGKSQDLLWLARQGHQVVGVELSPQAAREFFEENKITPGQGVRIDVGDFFSWDPGPGFSFGALYDRAALIALPPELRARYSRRIIELVKKYGAEDLEFLQVTLCRTPLDLQGPPFSVSPEEVMELYGGEFEVKLVDRSPVTSGASAPAGGKVEECVLRLRRR